MAGTVEQFPGQQSSEAVKIAVAFAKDGTRPENDLVLITPVVIPTAHLDPAVGSGDAG